MDTNKIKFTEFVRPNARKVVQEYTSTPEVYSKFLEIEKLGLRLTLEDLNTGLYNVCIEIPNEADFISRLCASDGIEDSFNKMILDFKKDEFIDFRKSLDSEDETYFLDSEEFH